MKRGISSLSFSGPLPNKIEAAAKAGFDGIEIFREDLVHCDGTPAEVARFIADTGLEVLGLQSLRDFEAAPDAIRAWNVKRATRFLDLAVEVGAPLLVVCANTRADTVDDPTGRRPIWHCSRTWRRNGAFASATRRWPRAPPYALMSKPGASSKKPAVRTWASFSASCTPWRPARI
jgi:sugar phosphate isomerase/epimerase